MKRSLLTLALALAAVTVAVSSEAASETTTAVHRGCHKMGVRRPGRNGTTHHHVKKAKRSAKPVATNAAPTTVAQPASAAAK